MAQTITLQQAFDIAERHQQTGNPAAAETIYHQILAQHPNHPDALNQLGLLAMDAGKNELAVDWIRRALSANPASAEYHSNLGNALHHAGKNDEALAAARRALELKPNFPEALSNLAIMLHEMGRFEEAIATLEQAISQNNQIPAAHYNLGNSLRALGRCEPAIAAYRRAIALQPDHGLAHYNLGLALLLSGDYANGWREYDYRFEAPELQLKRRTFAQPQWDGRADLDGKHILIYGEQGFGDVVQFARYVTLMAQRGADVTLVCQPELKHLMQRLDGVKSAVAFGEPVQTFDFHGSVMDLGRCFGTTPKTIPTPIPYLRADLERADFWKTRLRETRGQLKAGLFWHGRPKPNPRRSIPLAQLAPLVEVKEISWISLQKGAGSDQARTPPPGMDFSDWTDDLADFADTAALIANLDLVIAVDSTVAHIAGALGKPAWLLLPLAVDWRWMLNRSDSPWYPTMRLFRQTAVDEWEPPIRSVVAALRELVDGGGP